MKMRAMIVVMTVLLTVGLTVLTNGCGKGDGERGQKLDAVQYHCPMHPTVVSDQPGDCPMAAAPARADSNPSFDAKPQPTRRLARWQGFLVS